MTKDILEKSFIASNPNWLRWTLFIPVSLMLTFIAAQLLFIVQLAVGLRDVYFLDFIRTSIVLFIFLFSASLIAPKAQARIALILGGIISLITLLLSIVIIFTILKNGKMGLINVAGFIAMVLIVLGVSAGTYFVIRKLSR